MSEPAAEGDQDDDDILGFPGDGFWFEDQPDANPGVLMEQDEEGDETPMEETTGGSGTVYQRLFPVVLHSL